jgi:hypothetical protein
MEALAAGEPFHFEKAREFDFEIFDRQLDFVGAGQEVERLTSRRRGKGGVGEAGSWKKTLRPRREHERGRHAEGGRADAWAGRVAGRTCISLWSAKVTL